MDELADATGEDPVTYRLSLLSDPRSRRVVETAARISGWFERDKLPEGRAKDPLRERIVLDHEDAGAWRGVHAPHAATAAKSCTSDCRLSEDNGLCSSRVTIR